MAIKNSTTKTTMGECLQILAKAERGFRRVPNDIGAASAYYDTVVEPAWEAAHRAPIRNDLQGVVDYVELLMEGPPDVAEGLADLARALRRLTGLKPTARLPHNLV